MHTQVLEQHRALVHGGHVAEGQRRQSLRRLHPGLQLHHLPQREWPGLLLSAGALAFAFPRRAFTPILSLTSPALATLLTLVIALLPVQWDFGIISTQGIDTNVSMVNVNTADSKFANVLVLVRMGMTSGAQVRGAGAWAGAGARKEDICSRL